MMQRMSIASPMMHDPQVLFLASASVGLAPQTRLLLWEIIREYIGEGRTILLTTHNMEEADALCQRLAIIDHGHVIALATPEQLKASIPGGFCCAFVSAIRLRNWFSGYSRWRASARCAFRTARAPTFMR